MRQAHSFFKGAAPNSQDTSSDSMICKNLVILYDTEIENEHCSFKLFKTLGS